MYLCTACGGHAPARQPLLKHVVYKPPDPVTGGRQIESEHPLCPGCYARLKQLIGNGTYHPFDALLTQMRQRLLERTQARDTMQAPYQPPRPVAVF